VDYYLEQKISWWHKIAEVGRPVQEQPVPAAVVPAQRAALPVTADPADPAIPLVPVMDGAEPEPVTH
jgi:hypothetical protein